MNVQELHTCHSALYADLVASLNPAMVEVSQFGVH